MKYKIEVFLDSVDAKRKIEHFRVGDRRERGYNGMRKNSS